MISLEQNVLETSAAALDQFRVGVLLFYFSLMPKIYLHIYISRVLTTFT